MDIVALLGFLLSFALMIFGIVFNTETFELNWDTMQNFIDYGSVFITIGGTFAALMISMPAKAFPDMISHMKIVYFPTKYDPLDYIDQIVEFAKEARMKGLLSLEEKLSEVKDPFLKSSLLLVVDSVEPEKVKNLLEAELDFLDERHKQGRAFYDKGAAYGPAFGMIGTLIGLVNMLKDMQDASVIGPAMSVALITTFYGTVLANVFFAPFASKLQVRHDEEYLCKLLICEGVESIQAGENPKFIEEKLTLLVPPSSLKKRKKKSSDAAD